MRNIEQIIETAGGFSALVEETGLTLQAVRKWPVKGVPDWHWPMLIRRAEATADELLAANQRVRPAETPRKGKRKEAAQ